MQVQMNTGESFERAASGARDPVTIRARAPLRISFAGGGTDVPPFPQTEGGCVLSATIDFYAYSSLLPGPDSHFEVRSPDLGTVFRMTRSGSRTDDNAPQTRKHLVEAVLKEFPQSGELFSTGSLVLHSDAPPGSGLGSSSALIVAMTATMAYRTGEALGPYELAERAAKIERTNLEIPGGYQDHYAATFGGFNFIEFEGDGALVHPLALRSDTVDELHASLTLCFTGRTRLSGHILERQIEAYERKEKSSVEALRRLKQLAIDMRAALLRGRLREFAEGLAEGWEAKKKLAEGISHPELDELYEYGTKNGAIAGKVLGAGGGGYFLFYSPVERSAGLRQALEERGFRVVPFSFERRGVQIWRAPYF